MADVADLELLLRRWDAGRYLLDLRVSMPGSDAEVRPLRDRPAPAQIDLAALRSLALDPQAYGAALTQMVFADPAAATAFAQARAAAQDHGVALRIRVALTADAAELHAVRWETLRDPVDGALLSTSEWVRLTRYLSSGDWRTIRLRGRGDLRALALIASPADLPDYGLAPLDVAGEQSRLLATLAGVPTTVLAGPTGATLAQLIAQVRRGCDILCIVAHGALVDGEPWLFLEDERGHTVRVAGAVLATALAELIERPRLVVLASCVSAGAGDGHDNAMVMLGPRLAEAGIPAVLAMQGQVSMQTTAAFLPVFFAELVRDGQIDRAVSVARAAVRARSDFWSPVLFTRLKSGRIWYTPGFAGELFRRWPALLRSIEQGKCTPILGPGLLETLVGSPREVARRWAEEYHFPLAPHAREDLPQVAQYLAVDQNQGFLRSELGQSLRKELLARFGDRLPAALNDAPLVTLLSAVRALRCAETPYEPHAVLAALPFPIYLSTNPDDLLAEALRAKERPPRCCSAPGTATPSGSRRMTTRRCQAPTNR